MQDQPKAKPYRASSFFKDGLSSRPIVEGTVPRGWLRTNTEFFTGKKKVAATTAQVPNLNGTSGNASSAGTTNGGAGGQAAAYSDDVEKIPLPITKDVLDRGEVRFQIFCSACHGMTGEGDGIVVRRGFRKPPSFYEKRLRDAPAGHYFDVVTNGWGAMPNYAAQIPVQDRWAIVAFIRALQLTRPSAPPTATSANATAGGPR